MLLTFAKINKRQKDFHPNSVWLPAPGKQTLTVPVRGREREVYGGGGGGGGVCRKGRRGEGEVCVCLCGGGGGGEWVCEGVGVCGGGVDDTKIATHQASHLAKTSGNCARKWCVMGDGDVVYSCGLCPPLRPSQRAESMY